MKLTIHQSGAEEKEAIIFLHGLGVSSWMWHDQIEALQANYHCIAIDLPGSGDSHAAAWESLADSAKQVAEIIESHAAGSQAHVVGLSMGGYVALKLLSNHPELVKTMVVSGVTVQPLMRELWIKPVSAILSRMVKWPIMGRLSARMMQFPDEVVPIYMQDLKRMSADMVKRVYREVLPYTMPAIDSNVAYRLLITGGDKEAKAILTSFQEFKAKLPEVTVTQAPNAHHGWNAEHPELFTALIEAWTSGHSLPADMQVIHQPEKMIA
ncbi:MAG: alpha/beta fold hydrolase [Anaerolineae bacterium]